ncbi:hypothetical protein C8R46DRAFT_1185555 [Mycena filopes]|nr:hypothetical protein C8R46DRAFT_1185555 [Mycena filopes]
MEVRNKQQSEDPEQTLHVLVFGCGALKCRVARVFSPFLLPPPSPSSSSSQALLQASRPVSLAGQLRFAHIPWTQTSLVAASAFWLDPGDRVIRLLGTSDLVVRPVHPRRDSSACTVLLCCSQFRMPQSNEHVHGRCDVYIYNPSYTELPLLLRLPFHLDVCCFARLDDDECYTSLRKTKRATMEALCDDATEWHVDGILFSVALSDLEVDGVTEGKNESTGIGRPW